MKKIRILCLHGFYSNAQVTAHQMSYYSEAFGPSVEFVPVNGPYEVMKVYDSNLASKFRGPFYGWFTPMPSDPASYLLDEGIDKIVNVINERGPFHGIMGFSQGSGML
jgi:hypothetical protein